MDCLKVFEARLRPQHIAGIQLAVALTLVLAFTSPALAQKPTPTLNEINAVARELYCPLCNGVRLDTCELQACVQMRQVIANRLDAGASKEQIKAEFVAQYGPVVLGEPPRQGLDLLAWIAPAALLLGGAAWLLIMVRRWTQQPARQAAHADVIGPASPAPNASSAAPEEYLARIEADLEDDSL